MHLHPFARLSRANPAIRKRIQPIVRSGILLPRVVACRKFSLSSSHRTAKQSQSESKTTLYDYPKIKELSSRISSDDNIILIDVREPCEVASGSIPTSVNLPLTKIHDAWRLSPEEFQERFGFEKPDKDKELVFYCQAGVRSTLASISAEQAGYRKIGNYVGSWQDWFEQCNNQQRSLS